jgi:hypothetical protein
VKRRAVPLAIKLRVALRQLGLDPDHVELDHTPPLALRERDAAGRYIPDEHDERCLVWMDKRAHRRKTTGTHVPLSGDISVIAKTKRQEKDQEAFRSRLLVKVPGQPRLKTGRIQSRGFPTRQKERP